MKKSFTSMLVLCAAGLSTAGLLGKPQPQFPPLSAASKLAVVGFSLDKSIVITDGERDEGPGIIQKPEDYYRLHQAIVDSMWTIFRDTMPAIFAGLNVLPVDSLVNDPAYGEALRCQPKKLMGKIVVPCPDLEPKGGLVAVGNEIAKPVLAWGAKKGFDRYMVVENKVEYFLSAGAGVNDLVAGAGKMRTITTLSIVDPAKGIVWIKDYTNESNSSAPMVNKLFPESKWILSIEGFRLNLAAMAKDIAGGKTP